MISIENPWINMGISSQRRVDYQISHNIFWVTDLNGNYGFCIQAKKESFTSINTIILKGISIVKRPIEELVELFLILNDRKDWQIFHVLCEDLIEVAKSCNSNEKMISTVEIRLKRWQQLLKQERNSDFSVEKQMGLFSELLCLNDIISPKYGIITAIKSWVGPDYDKQDFLLDNMVIEVKSYRTSKGDIITISSKDQLYSEKEPFYLLSYALTTSDRGLTVEDVICTIKGKLSSELDDNLMDIFENKLMDYGYIPEIIKEPLQKFKLDNQRVFHITEDFPKISPQNIMNQIISVKYTIDLSKCKDFEIKIESLFEKGE